MQNVNTGVFPPGILKQKTNHDAEGIDEVNNKLGPVYQKINPLSCGWLCWLPQE